MQEVKVILQRYTAVSNFYHPSGDKNANARAAHASDISRPLSTASRVIMKILPASGKPQVRAKELKKKAKNARNSEAGCSGRKQLFLPDH